MVGRTCAANSERTASLCASAGILVLCLLLAGCASTTTGPADITDDDTRDTRLALWLAKKAELIAHADAEFDLVLSGWFEQSEADDILDRNPNAKLLAGLTVTWILDDPAWQGLLVTVANGGDPDGPLQITDDMYLMFDSDDDGELDTHCSPPGWDDILAMDPRHTGWRQLVLSFYGVVGAQPQHDGVVIDMVDAYPFCEGAWSEGVPESLSADAWVNAQAELLEAVRDTVPAAKWVFANAGRDFPAGSPFPQHLNGYLLENALGEIFGLETVDELLESADRARTTTQSPHMVVYSVDTDDTDVIDPERFRLGLAASLLRDHTYFAFDSGPRDHGGVNGWWFADYYDIELGAPEGPAIVLPEGYVRDFATGRVVVALEGSIGVSFDEPYRDTADATVDMSFTVSQGDARIFLLEP